MQMKHVLAQNEFNFKIFSSLAFFENFFTSSKRVASRLSRIIRTFSLIYFLHLFKCFCTLYSTMHISQEEPFHASDGSNPNIMKYELRT